MASATRTGDGCHEVRSFSTRVVLVCVQTIHGIGWAAEATFSGRQMHNGKEVEMAVSEWLRMKEYESNRNGIFEPVQSWAKCCNVLWNCAEH